MANLINNVYDNSVVKTGKIPRGSMMPSSLFTIVGGAYIGLSTGLVVIRMKS